MSITQLYPPGVPCWIEVVTPDLAEVAPFYEELFGWQFDLGVTAPDGGTFLIGSVEGGQVAGLMQTEGKATVGSWRTYLRVVDLDATTTTVVENGGVVHTPAVDVPGLARSALFTDPAGGVFGARELTGHRGAEQVNAPNTWNFNTLRTPDSDGATRFYGAVFGWRAIVADFGFATGTMWCLPGYGDFLDARNPGWKQGHLDGGSPPGFTDAVGWLEKVEVGADWTAEFHVANAGRTAKRATELGGQVLSGPLDVGGTGSAVLADPCGARFTVNDYDSASG